MTLRPTPGSARQVVALDYEIAQEQASALGRLGCALEAALAALADFDRQFDRMAPYEPVPDHRPSEPAGPPPEETRKARAKLVQEASHALWCFIVQRESCGLRDPRPVIRDYRVPAEVQNRMGILVLPQLGQRPRRRPHPQNAPRTPHPACFYRFVNLRSACRAGKGFVHRSSGIVHTGLSWRRGARSCHA